MARDSVKEYAIIKKELIHYKSNKNLYFKIKNFD